VGDDVVGTGVGVEVVVVEHTTYPAKQVVVEGRKGRQSSSTGC
jgi:hypothetical protein